MRFIGPALAFWCGLAAAFGALAQGTRDPAIWPRVKSPYGLDKAMEAKIDGLIGQMSVEQKVGQMIQAEIKSISPQDVRDFHIGSVLSGGGSFPGETRSHPLALWVAAANAYYDASMDTSKGGLAIPVIWGIDAVHGHNNVIGATLFPHNVGLGAANNPGLMRDIGTATAREIAATGLKWTFAPTVAVARDDRWGRTYESYSEDPNIVARLSMEMVLGLQGHPALGNPFAGDKVIGTAKHFVGDGGTQGGKDQGDTVLSESDLYAVHGRGFVQALGVGVQTVMASFSSWNGEKLHGHKYLLTDILKERMGFDGFVVGDWNGHEQLDGCSQGSCPKAINAGVDLIMVPEQWRAFHRNTVRQVKAGDIPMARIDDAVRRILRVKMRAGLFEDARPSSQPLAARFALIGHPDHRAVAREAVRESLVLLKNDGALPVNPGGLVLVAGEAADSVPLQSGGWSVTWQGRDTTNKDFPGATTIWTGIKSAVEEGRGRAIYSKDGSYGARPDVAIVVFGETPYAEFEGDRPGGLNFEPSAPLDLLRKLKDDGVPTVAVFLSGRPLAVPEEIEAANAFVAAWLPGSEGAGIADVLFTDRAGKVRHDFKGKLPFSWPRTPDQSPLNAGDAGYDPAFALGHGLTYAKDL